MDLAHENDVARVDAIARQDAVDYARLCNQGGITPDDSVLYEKGLDLLRLNVVFENVNKSYKPVLEHKLDSSPEKTETKINKIDFRKHYVPSSSRGFKRAIRDYCRNHKMKTPSGVHRMKMPELRHVYAGLLYNQDNK